MFKEFTGADDIKPTNMSPRLSQLVKFLSPYIILKDNTQFCIVIIHREYKTGKSFTYRIPIDIYPEDDYIINNEICKLGNIPFILENIIDNYNRIKQSLNVKYKCKPHYHNDELCYMIESHNIIFRIKDNKITFITPYFLNQIILSDLNKVINDLLKFCK